MADSNCIIVFDAVSKTFGDQTALDAVSLEVQAGEILAVVGHNGAGKSTMLALIVGLLRPTKGDVFVRGISVRRDPTRARRGIGSVLGPAFHDYLSGWDNLRLLTSYSAPVAPAEMLEVVTFVGLTERIRDPVRTYSHGMRARLALAQALLPLPEVLLLDEPEEGLDPEGTRDMRMAIRRINRERGVTVVLASHQLTGGDQTCDRMALLEHGRLAFLGGWSAVDARASVRLELDDWETARPLLERMGVSIAADGRVVLGVEHDVADVLAVLVRAGVRVQAAEPARRTLEELYVRARAAVDARRAGAPGQ
jgi:ABC-2 type transport system ATP-binding protein